jgi:hypothetical protein
MTRDWWWTWWSPPQFVNHPIFRENEQWALDYMPSDKPEVHSVVLQFAESRYDQICDVFEKLDKKADDLIRTAGAIGAALVAAAKFVEVGRPSLVAPAVACLVLASIVATRARGPALLTLPIHVRDLLKVADLEIVESKGQVEAAAAASLHCAIMGMRTINDWKATQLQRASAFFCGSLVLLLLLIFPV